MTAKFAGSLAVWLLAVGLRAETTPAASATSAVQVAGEKAASAEILPPEKAKEFIGKAVVVEGPVTGIRFLEDSDRKPVFLNFGEPFPKHCFTVVIFGKDRAKFGDTPPEKLFDGRRVRVKGLVEKYRGKPQIVVEDPAQIEIVPAPDAPKN